MNRPLTMRIGVDLGGTKIEALALGPDGQALLRRRVATPRGDYRATLEAVATLVEGLERDLGRRGSVGVGIPGAVSPATGLVKNANSVWLIGQPFDRDLGARLGRPVRTANDANCLALSEAVDGAAAGFRAVFGVILGTGVGGGIVIDGRPLIGRNVIAGEWGHNPLPWPSDEERPGPACYCGKSGCVETFLSGPGLARDHLAAGGGIGEVEDIAAQATRGNPVAQGTLARYWDRLARALAQVVNILDPDAIVFGGGLSKIEGLTRSVNARLGRYVFSDRVETTLAIAKHGDSSGVRGAAWLWDKEELDKTHGVPAP
jgi:fructokinase